MDKNFSKESGTFLELRQAEVCNRLFKNDNAETGNTISLGQHSQCLKTSHISFQRLLNFHISKHHILRW